MNTIFLSIIVLLEILQYMIFVDVLLSWLFLFGTRFRPKFIRSILDPLYEFVRKYIPTRLGAFDFTPIVLILLILFIRGTILMYAPGVSESIHAITRY